jgi:uncharacterized membrane protein (DUF4010 family)
VSDLETAFRLCIAGLTGLAVGVEREWSGHAAGPNPRFAGVRTFFLLGLLGGLSGWLLQAADPIVAGALLLGAAGFVVAAYLMAARRGGEAIEGTTEAAALLVLGIGVLAGMGNLRIASGAAAVVVIVLREKSNIHGFLRRIGEEELRAGVQFAVLALVVLPLLPEGPIGPFGGIKPRGLWTVVLIFTGLNFAGYMARRILGDSRGYPTMGALGGLVSSTAVALTFSRRSRQERGSSESLAVGTLAACTVLVPRVLAVILVLNADLFPAAAVGLGPVLLAGVVMVVLQLRHRVPKLDHTPESESKSPLQLWSAIRMAVAFQLVITLLDFLTQRFGEVGALATAAILGMTDMDALTFGMSRLAETDALVVTAARAVVLGMSVNSVFKASLAMVLGSPEFRRTAVPRLLLLAVAGGAGFWLIGRLIPPG